LLHAVAVAAFCLPTLAVDRADRPLVKAATTIFTPSLPSEPPEQPPEPRVTSNEARLEQPRIKLPETAFPDPPVTYNLSAMGLSFADDVHGQLPEVIRAQRGMLALLDKEDPTIAVYLFEAPAWEPRKTIRDVSRMLRIEMYPPRVWPVFRDAADQHGIVLDSYRAAALFDIGYGGCLKEAIRRYAKGAPVSAAVLEVAPGSPCGFEVQEVTLAASPTLHR
jgi:hypothetical protein